MTINDPWNSNILIFQYPVRPATMPYDGNTVQKLAFRPQNQQVTILDNIIYKQDTISYSTKSYKKGMLWFYICFIKYFVNVKGSGYKTATTQNDDCYKTAKNNKL